MNNVIRYGLLPQQRLNVKLPHCYNFSNDLLISLIKQYLQYFQ